MMPAARKLKNLALKIKSRLQKKIRRIPCVAKTSPSYLKKTRRAVVLMTNVILLAATLRLEPARIN